MKNVLILTAFFCVSGFTFLKAQPRQGKILIGTSSNLSLVGAGSELMSIGFISAKEKSDADGFDEGDPSKSTSFNFIPRIGYFEADNFAVGLDVSYAFSKTKEEGYESKQNLWSVGPFIRYYIPAGKVMPFIEAAGALGGLKLETSSSWGSGESKLGIFSIGGGAGIAVLLGERATFDVMAGYNSFTLKEKENNDDNERTVYGILGIKFGFSILLGAG